MIGNPGRHCFYSRLSLACVLTAGLGLSGCTALDRMFGNGTETNAPAQGQPTPVRPRDEVRAASSRCDNITDERTWLDCYYGAAQPVRAELGLPPALASQQSLVPPPAN
jgi:hypothetical protein